MLSPDQIFLDSFQGSFSGGFARIKTLVILDIHTCQS